MLQLLDLLEEFVTACGESRKLVPHAATMRGQALKLTVTFERPAGRPELPPPNAIASESAADGSGGGSGGGRALGGLVNALASVPGTHRRTGSAGATAAGDVRLPSAAAVAAAPGSSPSVSTAGEVGAGLQKLEM